MTFIEWLHGEMESRGWDQAELERRIARFDSTNPSPEFCLSIARVMGISPEDVLRKAGFLPPARPDDPARELVEIVRLLDDDSLAILVQLAGGMVAELEE